MWPKPGQGLDRVLAGEAAVEGLYREALTRWSPVAMAAALPTFGAAVTADASPDSTASTDPQLPPDPAAVEQSSGWTTVAETVIVAGVAVLFAACPCGINAYLFAERYRQGMADASSAIALSTALSLFTTIGWLTWLGAG